MTESELAADRRPERGRDLAEAAVVFVVVSVLWLAIGLLTGKLTTLPAGDEPEYLARGAAVLERGWAALSDGYRPPLLPLSIAFVTRIVGPDSAAVATRIVHVLATAAVPALWWWGSSAHKQRGALRLMAAFTAAWLPFHWFAFQALAEAWSLFALNVAVYALLRPARPPRLAVAGLALGAMVLLKPNQLILTGAVCVWLVVALERPLRERVRAAAVVAGTVALMVAPWLFVMKTSVGDFRLTTTGGHTLLAGTGYHSFGMTLERSSLPWRFLESEQVAFAESPHGPSALPAQELDELLDAYETASVPLRRAAVDDVSRQAALRIWLEHPGQQALHGISKVLHSFGGSLRGGLDYFEIVFLLMVGLASIFLTWRRSSVERVVLLHWLLAGTGVVVAFLFLPNIRFKTVHFDTTGLLVLAFAGERLLQSRRSAARTPEVSVALQDRMAILDPGTAESLPASAARSAYPGESVMG